MLVGFLIQVPPDNRMLRYRHSTLPKNSTGMLLLGALTVFFQHLRDETLRELDHLFVRIFERLFSAIVDIMGSPHHFPN